MTDIVLWNAKEAAKHCEEFVKSYAQIRSDLLDHYDHKGHVALRYSDDWAGFHAYCAERLKLDSKLDTIKLQISTAKVSREVGVEVPMVISRQLAKLPPEQQKGVYDEVIGAREKAGQRSANQMEPDVRRVVRRVMGVEEKPEKEPVSTTDSEVSAHNRKVDEHYRDMGISTPAEQMAALVPIDPETAERFKSGPFTEPIPWPNQYNNSQLVSGPVGEIALRENAQETEAVIDPKRIMLCEFYTAYRDNNQEALLALFSKVGAYLAAN